MVKSKTEVSLVDALLLTAGIGLVLLLLGLERLGSMMRARNSPTSGSEADEKRFNHVVSSVFGLLALLMGFTFSMALDRYEKRSEDVVAEANAIGSAHQHAALLGNPEGEALRNELQAYAELRLRYGHASLNEIGALLAASSQQRRQINAAALTASKPVSTTPLAGAVMSSAEAVGDIGVEREARMKAKLPGAIFAVLVAFICIAVGTMGYAYPESGRHHRLAGLLLSTLLVVTLFLIIDLDRPLGGGIIVNQDAMQNLVKELQADGEPVSSAGP
jgi:hypothetical protein